MRYYYSKERERGGGGVGGGDSCPYYNTYFPVFIEVGIYGKFPLFNLWDPPTLQSFWIHLWFTRIDFSHACSLMFIYYCFSLTKIENISIENSDKHSVLLLSLKNFNIIQFTLGLRSCPKTLKASSSLRPAPTQASSPSHTHTTSGCLLLDQPSVSTLSWIGRLTPQS